MKPLAEATGHHGVAICANGAVVYDLHTDTVLESTPLEPAIARQLVKLLQTEVPGGAWAVERDGGGYGREPGYVPRLPPPDNATVDVVEALVEEPAIKLMLRHDRLSADVLLARAREVAPHLAEFSHSNSADGLLEISASGVSKASALARLCRERGIDDRDVIAFGDMPNDLPMLTWAGYAVAVANAHPDVIAAADEVTASNEESGVARVLERVFGLQPL
jgi:hypothetical protein